jgi:hypothetical protein
MQLFFAEIKSIYIINKKYIIQTGGFMRHGKEQHMVSVSKPLSSRFEKMIILLSVLAFVSMASIYLLFI